jgi:hypothetical protein
MALTLIGIESFSRMNWLDCSIGGICLGVLGVTLMSLALLMKDQVRLGYVPPWLSSLTLFLNIP